MKKTLTCFILILSLMVGMIAPASAAGIVYFPRCDSRHTSLVDALASVGAAEYTSFEARFKIAEVNGYSDGSYVGQASANIALLNKLKAGVLVNPFASGSQTDSGIQYYPRCASHYTSIVDALASIGVDSSFSNRAKIAALNGIVNYSGSASQNVTLLNLEKQGKLIRSLDTSAQSLPSTENIVNVNPYVCYNYQQCTADGHSIYEVTKDNAPLREKASNEGNIITRLEAGQLLSVAQVVRNNKGNKWAKIQYTDENGNVKNAFVYTGNISAHNKHEYTTVFSSKEGSISMCIVCAHTVVKAGNKTASQHLMGMADQAIRGDYADSDTTFWGLVSRVLVGEIPYVGWFADARDLIYDLTHDAHIGIIALDVACLIPMVSLLKHVDNAYSIHKNADEVIELTEGALRNSVHGDVFYHVFKGNGIVNNKIIGAHNMDSFMNIIEDSPDALIDVSKTKKHASIDGIYQYTYSVNGVTGSKTVYDPDIFSDADIKKLALEAMYDAASRDSVPIKDVAESMAKDIWEGQASNGLWFRFYIDMDHTALNTFHPILAPTKGS